MFDKYTFTAAELVPVYGMLTIVLGIIIYGYYKDYRIFWSPLTVIAVIFAYYCLLGPYEAVTTGGTYDRLVNMRKYYPSALWGAWASISAICVGFILTGNKQRLIPSVPIVSDEFLFIYGRRLVIIGVMLFAVSTGGNVLGLVNPFDAEEIQQSTAGLSNYFFLGINFLIPGVGLLFVYWYRTSNQFWWFIISFLISLGVYISIGFRYRIILLLATIGITYYIARGKKPNIIVTPILIVGFIAMMGIIAVSRQYGHGLDAQKLEGSDAESYYKSGLRESRIFQTSGAVIDKVPSDHPHVYFAPIISTVLFPVPAQFYRNKNSAGYVLSILKNIYGETTYKGAAFMAYAEQYLAFGWAGIWGFGLLLGWLCKKLWVWFTDHTGNPFVLVAYATSLAYLYVVLSRGYLPQVTMLFFFSTFPAFFVIWMIRRRVARLPAFPNALK